MVNTCLAKFLPLIVATRKQEVCIQLERPVSFQMHLFPLGVRRAELAWSFALVSATSGIEAILGDLGMCICMIM